MNQAFRRYFIVGTDTDCGKTYVTCQLLDMLNAQGIASMAIKPVASGCIAEDDALVSSDVLQLQRHNRGGVTSSIAGWCFKPPISPHLAAQESGISLSVSAITEYCRQPDFSGGDCLLIEGAGGLMVPLNATETWLDFLVKTDIPVILVVGMTLGCINHALLTSLALKSHDISCVGWIANCLDKDMLALSGNINTLKDKMGFPWLATIPYGGSCALIGL